MAKFSFNLRTPGGVKPTPINFVARYGTQRLVYPTKETIPPDQWDAARQRAKGSPLASDLNARLSDLESRAGRLLSAYKTQHETDPTPEELRQLLDANLGRDVPRPTKADTLFVFIERYIEENETSKRVLPVTIRAYKVVLKKLQEFSKKTKAYRALDFDRINLDFYADFTGWLTKKGYSANYIGNHIKTLKSFLNEATERGINSKVDFRSKRFKKITEETSAIYLNEEELETLRCLDLSTAPRLDRVRNLFLVGCWTGLRFSDFTRLDPRHLTADGDFIEIETQKTGETVVIPVYPVVRTVFAKYAGKTANSLPPAISNQKMNEFLKQIAQRAGLTDAVEERITKGGFRLTTTAAKWELVSTHTARRSFATNCYKMGLDTVTIRAITGHRTEKAFLTYIKVTPHEHARKMKDFWAERQRQTPFLRAV